MFKKFIKLVLVFLGLFLLFGFLGISQKTQAQEPIEIQQEEQKTTLYFFWSQTCPHCKEEKAFLTSLKEKYPNLIIQDFEVSRQPENQTLLKKVGEKLEIEISGIPFTIIGENYFTGFLDEETTGKQIEKAVQEALANKSDDSLKDLIVLNSNLIQEKEIKSDLTPEKIRLPLFGSINIKNLSLPMLTFVIALLDGFNPCAMWTLLFLISLLLGMKNKKRRWLLGGVFIFTSGLVYFLFLSAWLNLFLFLGFVFWVRIMIGLIALGGGSYNLREYWVNKEAACKVTKGEKRQKVFVKMKAITQKEQLWLALIGIILIAVAVNLVELVCSAGLPAIYTQILSLSNLPRWQYYLYLAFYIFIFMLDDMFVFGVAMITLQKSGLGAKYARFSRLIGGILLFLIGFLLLFKPEWLMFG